MIQGWINPKDRLPTPKDLNKKYLIKYIKLLERPLWTYMDIVDNYNAGYAFMWLDESESTPSFTREDMKGFDAWKNTCGYKQDHISKFYWKAADPLQKQITFDQLLDLYLNNK